MNPPATHHKILDHLLLITIGLSLLLTQAVFAQSDATTTAETAMIWADGNDHSVCLVAAQKRNNQDGFQIFIRKKTADEFIPGRWYAGKPLTIALFQNRVFVFLESGSCHSYDLQSTRTERRLPPGLKPINAAAMGNKLLVLAQTTQAVQIETILSNSAITEQNNTESNSSLFLKQNQWTILALEKNNRWSNICAQPLPLENWQQPKLCIEAETVRLFGILKKSSDQINNQLITAQIINAGLSDLEPIPCNLPLSITPLTVNKQIRLAIETSVPHESNMPTNPERQILLAAQTNGAWNLTDPLQRSSDQPLIIASPFCVTNMDQILVAFERADPKTIRYGFYRPDGSIEQDLTRTIQLYDRLPGTWMTWIAGPNTKWIIFMIVLALVYFKRQEAFHEPTALPGGFLPAPHWRRGLAWLLDSFPIFIASSMITVKFYPEFTTFFSDPNVLFTPPQTYQDFIIHQAFIVCLLISTALFITYQIICELTLGASLGKKALQLAVIDYQARKPQPRRIILRNIFRLLEEPLIILLLLIITRRRQRLGDLMGQTLVVTKAPASSTPPPSSPDDAADNNP